MARRGGRAELTTHAPFSSPATSFTVSTLAFASLGPGQGGDRQGEGGQALDLTLWEDWIAVRT